MSSMVRNTLISAALLSTFLAAPALAQEEAGRASLVATQASPQAAFAVNRWEQLSASPLFTFQDYAGFLLANPGFPDESKLRGYAEARLTEEFVGNQQLLAFFDRYPPQTGNGRAQYAIALMAARPQEA